MKKFSPGASISSDFAYGCDCCGEYGTPVLIWSDLPDNRDHFAICLSCLGSLYESHVLKSDKKGESIIIKRAVVSESDRNLIFQRDGHKCVKCGSTKNLSIDHIVPFSRGGKTTKENFQTLCMMCNLAKGSK